MANIKANLPADSAALVQGMVMGDRSALGPETLIAMQRSGLSHLLAVSGIHLNIFAACVLLILARLRLSRRAQSVITLLCGLVFLILTGFSPSVTRALVMMSVVMLAQFLSRRADTLNSIGIALLIICIVRPYWVLGMGIWFSAASCAGIAIFAGRIANIVPSRKERGFFANAIGVACSAYLFTLPLLFIMNGWIPLISPIANVLISPLVPILMVGGMLCAVLPSGFFLTDAAAALTHMCAGLLTGSARAISAMPYITISFDRFWILTFFAAFIIAVIILIVKRVRRKIWAITLAGCAILFITISLVDTWMATNRLELVYIGEEEYTGIVIRGRSAVLLEPPDRFNINQTMRYLSFRGIRNIDAVLAPNHGSRIDSGLIRLHESYNITAIIGPDDEYILGMLAEALPGASVYPSAYAVAELLGAMRVTFDDEVTIEIFHAIIDGRTGHGRAALTPVGGRLFGETRIIINV